MAYGWRGCVKTGVLVALSMVAVAGFCQGKYPAPGEPGTLDSESIDYLKYASVRVELAISREQESRAQALATSQIYKVALGAVMSYASGPDDQKRVSVDAVSCSPLNFTLPMSGLTLSQQRRLRQIAMQHSTLWCLLTPEVRLALDLTPPQIEKLKAMVKERQLRMEMVYKPVMTSFEPRFRDVAVMVNADEPNGQKRTQQISKAIDAYTELMLEMDRALRHVKYQDPFNESSLKVLTASQRARLRTLEGRPFKLATNL